MVSNQILQNVLVEIATITGVNAAIYGSDARAIAVRGDISGISDESVSSFIVSGESGRDSGEFYLNRISQDGEGEFIAAVKKNSANAYMASRLIAVQMESLIEAYKEREDRDSFIKNLLLDNLLQIDIYNRSRRLHIEFKEPRVVFIIRNDEREQQPIHETLKAFISSYEGDFITGTDENNQIIVHSLKNRSTSAEELYAFAESMYRVIKSAGISNAKIAYGSIVEELKDVSYSYKEAMFAHDVRSIFYEDRDIMSYGNLGIGRLIYQLPLPLCRLFINEIFAGKTTDEFDEEILMTINKFFENNLNVSETSRQLYIHRNTLVYRLDKLQKQTGLDLRIFEDAITFKIALMVVKYVEHMEQMEY